MAPLRRLTASLLAVVLLTAGCSSSTLPDGWERAEPGGLRLAHPQEWVPVPADRLTEPFTWGVQDQAGDGVTVQILGAPEFSRDRFSQEAVGRLFAVAQVGGLPGFRSTETRELEVSGASSGEEVHFTYEGHDGATYRGVWFAASDRDTSRSVVVQLVGIDLDADLVDAVRDSLELTGEPAG